MDMEFSDADVSWILSPAGWQRIVTGTLQRIPEGGARFAAPDGSFHWLAAGALMGMRTDQNEQRAAQLADVILRGIATSRPATAPAPSPAATPA